MCGRKLTRLILKPRSDPSNGHSIKRYVYQAKRGIMKIVFFLTALVIFTPQAFAGLGAPNIQAIARVELVDGEVLEGIILLGKGGYNSNYQPDAFCIVGRNTNYQLFPINLRFNRFFPNSFLHSGNKPVEVFYAKNISSQRRPKMTLTLESSKKEKVLKKITNEEEKYIFTKVITLHTELPANMHLAYVKETKNQILVDLKKIKSFSLVKDPSSKWLNYIKTSIKKLNSKMLEDEAKGAPWVDYAEPEWYHEVVKDKERFSYLNQFY